MVGMCTLGLKLLQNPQQSHQELALELAEYKSENLKQTNKNPLFKVLV